MAHPRRDFMYQRTEVVILEKLVQPIYMPPIANGTSPTPSAIWAAGIDPAMRLPRLVRSLAWSSTAGDPTRWLDFAARSIRYRQYAVEDRLLIWAACSQAVDVASAGEWEQDGYRVKADAEPILIRQPDWWRPEPLTVYASCHLDDPPGNHLSYGRETPDAWELSDLYTSRIEAAGISVIETPDRGPRGRHEKAVSTSKP